MLKEQEAVFNSSRDSDQVPPPSKIFLVKLTTVHRELLPRYKDGSKHNDLRQNLSKLPVLVP